MTENAKNEMKSANKISVLLKVNLKRNKIIDITCVIFIRMHLCSNSTKK